MRRKALENLQIWKTSPHRTPLLIRGARQVGKTWLVREFAKTFPSFVEINLEAFPEYHKPFKDFFGKPKELVATLSLLSGKKIIPGETLLFLDEIQNVREALLALRYFKEELPMLHVIACGSLLEFTIKDLSFPVGRIEFFHFFPLNFQEYLSALGREDLLESIRKAAPNQPLSEPVHNLLLQEISIYSLTGGMPEVLQAYIQTKELGECEKIQQRLMGTFREDFYKYAARAKIEHLQKMLEGIPKRLGQKFKYSEIDSEIRSRELAVALQLLIDAGLAYKAFHTSAEGVPLGAQTKEGRFKVFLLDIGLALKLLGLNLSQLFLERKTLLANRGALAEQLVAQELASYTQSNNPPRLYYWHREVKSSMAEVDFVLEKEGSVIPVEVKSGKSGKTKSLHLFMKEKEKFVSQALRISAENFGQNGKTMILPFYAVSKIFKP